VTIALNQPILMLSVRVDKAEEGWISALAWDEGERG
jgi:hypothetical protein